MKPPQNFQSVVLGVERLDSRLDLVVVVAVDGQDVEVERLELFFQRGAVHDRLGGAVDLEVVAVQHDTEVGELIVGGKHESLPALALFHLTVTEDNSYLRPSAWYLDSPKL